MLLRLLILGALVPLLAACASSTRPGAVGVSRSQLLLVPAADVERLAAASYAEQVEKARATNQLVESGPEYERVKAIGDRLIRQAAVFRDDTGGWEWRLALIDAPTVNALCAPGGKITVYSGLIRQLQPSDDEIAAILGHEIAHALREHGRERLSESMGQDFIVNLARATGRGGDLQVRFSKQVANVLFTLPNSREAENEADKIGLEMMARAGFDPGAAVAMWRKLAASAEGPARLEFLSTHPSYASRISELTALQPIVTPYFRQARDP